MKRKPSKKKASSRRRTIVKSLSLPKEIIDTGIARATALSRSFSNHVSVLIKQEAAAAK